MLYGPPQNLPNLFFKVKSIFFSGLLAGPTYWPLVQHSNPNSPLGRAATGVGLPVMNDDFGQCTALMWLSNLRRKGHKLTVSNLTKREWKLNIQAWQIKFV